MTAPDRLLIWYLRITALMLLSAAAAVVMPHAWMNAAHVWLGLGSLDDTPMIGYLTRSLSALYACLGACYWYLSRDVRRHLPLLRFTVPVTFLFATILVAIDLTHGMPMAWTIAEGTFLAAWTLGLRWLLRRCG